MTPPVPPLDATPLSGWQALLSSLKTLWVMALAFGWITTDISVKRHGWRCVRRLVFRMCALWGALAFLIIYINWQHRADIIIAEFSDFVGVINTPMRQAIVGSTLLATLVGMVYLIVASVYLIMRIIQYIAAGPPWLPWDRELDRQIKEEFHGGTQ